MNGRTGLKRIGITMMGVFMATAAGSAGVLYETTLADGGKNWTAVHNAAVSDVARRPGGKSLLIRQTADAEADSAWLSPVLKNPGGSLSVSLWAADNYDVQKDHSYAAAFEVVPCDQDGKLTSNGGDWTYLPWEDKRQIPQFRHTLTRDGLQWKYYRAVKRTAGDYFRVRLCWPKALMRGECYFTDIRVATAADATSTNAGPSVVADNRFTLEISTPANANLFFADDPLRFEFLLVAKPEVGGTAASPSATPNGAQVGAPDPLKDLKNPEIRYDITDYEQFKVASGVISFKGAAPVTEPKLGKAREQNLRLSSVITNAAARETGREFFLHAALVEGGRIVAEDTVTYAVVNPRKITDVSKARFVSFGEGGGFVDGGSTHERQSFVNKMGTSLVHDWDYNGWRKAQPEKGGPIVIKPGPDFPKLVYCPNLEQIRGRKPDHAWGDMSKNAPDWAIRDDPFHPGCKGFDIDGYVDYIVAFVRTNRNRIVQVVPSGLERMIDDRTLELQRKAYAALKKEFPDLPVGMMTWGVPDSAEQVNLILKEKLYETADFFNTHVYQSGVGWEEWKRLKKELKKLGVERRLISTEFACVGGNDQLQSSRDMIASMLDAHAHDMDRITYFLMYVNEVPTAPRRDPVLRGEFPGDGFQWMQYVDRPRVSDAITNANWGRGAYGTDQRGASLMPMLKTTAYYNFVQAVEGADFKAVFQPTDRTIAYTYERDGKTICYLFLREPNAPVTLTLQTDVPYVMQDLYGRNDRVTPAGASLVVATLDPLVLLFEGAVPALHSAATAAGVLKPAEGGAVVPVIARGASGKVTVTLPPVFNRPFTAGISATVDGIWPVVEAKTVGIETGKIGRVELPVSIAADQPAGRYTFTVRIQDGDKTVSVLKQPLDVGERLTAQLTGIPMTRRQDPAIAVSLRSLADVPMTGTIRIVNRSFGGFEPAVMEQAYTVAPKGNAEILFPVPREQVSLAVSYEMKAVIEDKSGFTLACEDDVSFQASVKTASPITVDGDLADWKLDDLVPVPFEKWHRGPCESNVFSGRFYSRWDDRKLYFAAEITDSTPVSTGMDEIGWNDDNIMLCLYPWGWHMGDPLNAGYYREHLGPVKNGKAHIMRAGYVPSGPAKPDGTEIAVRRTATGYVYEWSYEKSSLYPLALEKGGAFRLSLSVWDQRKLDKKDIQDWGEFVWLTFSGFNTSVNALPNLWRQFRLVDNSAVLEKAWKESVTQVDQRRQAIEKFALEGVCDNAAFTAKQALYKENAAALKAADAGQKVNPGPETPDHRQLREAVADLKTGLFVDAMCNMDSIPAVKALTDAYRAAMAERDAALAALNKERGFVTPLEYLQAQSKPVFKKGHTLPALTRYGWGMPFDLFKEFADQWGYALPLEHYLGMDRVKQVDNPLTEIGKTVALMKANPGVYKLSVICARFDPPNPPQDLWTRDASGHVLNAQAKSYDGTQWSPGMQAVISPEGPDQYWIDAGRGRAEPIAAIRKHVPVSIILNGGEWGLGVWGFAANAWLQDPKIVKAIESYKAKGLSRVEYLDDKTGNAQTLIAEEVKKSVSDRDLYVYYTSGGSGHRMRWGGWVDWGPTYRVMRGVSDLPSIECYVNHFNSGFAGDMDILTMALNAVGQQLVRGDTLSYNWFWAMDKKTSMRQYRGFLKCLYVMGTLGGNAGTYHQPDFNASFKPEEAPDWMRQQMALGHVHALFSHLEDDLRNGDLVDEGKYKHAWSVDQPAWELLPRELESTVLAKGQDKVLPLGRPFRVVVRKHRAKPQWLAEAWTAEVTPGDGKEYDATVTIPGAGEVTLRARPAGSTYRITLKDGKPVAALLDPDVDNPSAAFAP